MSLCTSCEVSLSLGQSHLVLISCKKYIWTLPIKYLFSRGKIINDTGKVSLRSIFKARTEPPDVNILQKVSLRSIFKVSTEPSGVNFLHKIICPQASRQKTNKHHSEKKSCSAHEQAWLKMKNLPSPTTKKKNEGLWDFTSFGLSIENEETPTP